MKIVYQTIDGCTFSEPANAERHEMEVRKHCHMWDGKGEPTDDTLSALILHLVGEGAGELFLKIAAAQGAEDYTSGIEPDISGWLLWDEGYETYRWVDADLIAALARIWLSDEEFSN